VELGTFLFPMGEIIMALHSGERQVTTEINEIRADHVARYEFAAGLLAPGATVIDFACGIGYGARIMSGVAQAVQAYDIDRETIEYARANYSNGATRFEIRNGEAPGELPASDWGVSFETIEHIEDPRPLLLALRQSCQRLVASVPNESVMPWQRADGTTTAFHFRHYTRIEFAELLESCGWAVDEWHGQLGPESQVERDVQGRTLVAVCSRADIPEQKPRKSIAIIGLGPSSADYMDLIKRQGGRRRVYDQVWSINAMGDVLNCDVVFHMDDVRIQEVRAAARPQSNIAAMLEWMKTCTVPIVSSRAHPDYPSVVEFPLEDVLNDLGHAYFNSTAAYAVAFAIWAEATEISIFGMDFSYPNVHDAEKGRGCVEFWLGKAHQRGIKLHFPRNTTLMDSNLTEQQRLYGYDTRDVHFNVNGDGALKITYTEREKLPTAEQIEAAYDHSAPINKQHLIERG
jgi:protein-L-isoaspartate O-methyltransferase